VPLSTIGLPAIYVLVATTAYMDLKALFDKSSSPSLGSGSLCMAA
jgi:hypothetical protein